MRNGQFFGGGVQAGRVLGIPIRLDLSFFLAFALIIFLLRGQMSSALPEWERWGYAAVGGVIFFVSLLLHELAHSLTARRYGMEVASITLFLFGGVSLIKEDSQRPGQEFLIAIVGPLTSLIIGLGFIGLWLALGSGGSAIMELVAWLGFINVALAIFNMLPGFPLDGGRVLRAALWRVTGSEHRSTRWAARVGQLLGAAMIAFGVIALFVDVGLFSGSFNSLWMAFVGFLLLSQASQGVKAADLERDLAALRVGELMLKPPQAGAVEAELLVSTLAPQRDALDHRAAFIVSEHDVAIGIVPAAAILMLDEERYHNARMRDVMIAADAVQPVTPETRANEALRRLQSDRAFLLPVVEGGRLLGVVGLDQIAAALHRPQPGQRAL